MTIFGILLSLLVFYPVYYVVIASLSKPLYVENGSVMFAIKHFTLESYRQAVAKPGVWTAYGNTIFYTTAGVLVNMIFSTTMAYALSKKKLVLRKFFTLFTIFTMWFNAGIIPTYLTFRDFNLLNTRTAIILGFAINTYNMIIMKSFFEQVPYELEEAAYIDGADHFTIFFRIFLPLSKPALATVGMFYGVNRWNSYFWAMQLVNDDTKAPLQVLLKKMMVDRVANASEAAIVTQNSLSSPTTVIYAMIVIAILPVLVVFPFVQKYFKTGLTVGGVKG
ncbi:MAG: carbohydrate ABC transporter permease [Hungatella sp.]|nr:carbohydrate ABC transporter permease [Hungatella sp.]